VTYHLLRALKRQLDLLILWPACRARAGNIDRARGAFFLHMQLDPSTYGDMSVSAKIHYAEALKP
jgi:hypothetical protein